MPQCRRSVQPSASSGAAASGFTLLELVITMVLAAVLTAVALPNFSNLTARAKAVGAKQGIHTLLLKAQAAVKSGEIGPDQLLAQSLDGMEAGSTMAAASDGKFAYSGRVVSGSYVVEAEPIGEPALAGQTMTGCIDLDEGTIAMQRDFATPFRDCGPGQGWGAGGNPNR